LFQLTQNHKRQYNLIVEEKKIFELVNLLTKSKRKIILHLTSKLLLKFAFLRWWAIIVEKILNSRQHNYLSLLFIPTSCFWVTKNNSNNLIFSD